MGGIATWVMSIVGIVILALLVDIVVAEGDLNKYIKSILSLVVVCVIISPLPKFFQSGFSYEKIFPESEMYQDEAFLVFIYEQRINEMKNRVKEELLKEGFEFFDVAITVENKNNQPLPKYVHLDLKKVVIHIDAGNINIVEKVKTTVSKTLGIPGEAIFVAS